MLTSAGQQIESQQAATTWQKNVNKTEISTSSCLVIAGILLTVFSMVPGCASAPANNCPGPYYIIQENGYCCGVVNCDENFTVSMCKVNYGNDTCAPCPEGSFLLHATTSVTATSCVTPDCLKTNHCFSPPKPTLPKVIPVTQSNFTTSKPRINVTTESSASTVDNTPTPVSVTPFLPRTTKASDSQPPPKPTLPKVIPVTQSNFTTSKPRINVTTESSASTVDNTPTPVSVTPFLPRTTKASDSQPPPKSTPPKVIPVTQSNFTTSKPRINVTTESSASTVDNTSTPVSVTPFLPRTTKASDSQPKQSDDKAVAAALVAVAVVILIVIWCKWKKRGNNRSGNRDRVDAGEESGDAAGEPLMLGSGGGTDEHSTMAQPQNDIGSNRNNTAEDPDEDGSGSNRNNTAEDPDEDGSGSNRNSTAEDPDEDGSGSNLNNTAEDPDEDGSGSNRNSTSDDLDEDGTPAGEEDLPTVIVSQTTYLVVTGQAVTLSCQVSGTPVVTFVAWKRSKNGVISTLTIDGSHYSGGTTGSPSLIISSVDCGDIASYVCTVSNAVGTSTSDTIFLSLTGSIPTVVIGQTKYSLTTGQSATLGCTVTAVPAATSITWGKTDANGNTNTINVNGVKYTGGTTGTPSLTIVSAVTTDSGNYRCSATNSIGTGQSEQTYLYITGGNGSGTDENITAEQPQNDIGSNRNSTAEDPDEGDSPAGEKSNGSGTDENITAEQPQNDIESNRNSTAEDPDEGDSPAGEKSICKLS
ncbi:Neural cell adhesion molecule 1 [Mizuhopecten yessoensis]|uniref:Neural cell adhesion molecule 1 n=1 Tax=Mizuhopecten yessoensis TaxID=6573 RepID=A0A210QER8_MIZYE|nr:Neural cell adhesion molecule 1 [Mizuhopecten yessoensis]